MEENSARVANGGLRGMGRGQPGGRALRLRQPNQVALSQRWPQPASPSTRGNQIQPLSSPQMPHLATLWLRPVRFGYLRLKGSSSGLRLLRTLRPNLAGGHIQLLTDIMARFGRGRLGHPSLLATKLRQTCFLKNIIKFSL